MTEYPHSETVFFQLDPNLTPNETVRIFKAIYGLSSEDMPDLKVLQIQRVPTTELYLALFANSPLALAQVLIRDIAGITVIT